MTTNHVHVLTHHQHHAEKAAPNGLVWSQVDGALRNLV